MDRRPPYLLACLAALVVLADKTRADAAETPIEISRKTRVRTIERPIVQEDPPAETRG